MIEGINVVVSVISLCLMLYILYYLISKQKDSSLKTKEKTETSVKAIKSMTKNISASSDKKFMSLSNILSRIKDVYKSKTGESLELSNYNYTTYIQKEYVKGLFNKTYTETDNIFLLKVINDANNTLGNFTVANGYLEFPTFTVANVNELENIAKIHTTLLNIESPKVTYKDQLDLVWLSNILTCDSFYNKLTQDAKQLNHYIKLIEFIALCEGTLKASLTPQFINNKLLKLYKNSYDWKIMYNVDFYNYIYFMLFGYELLNMAEPKNKNNVTNIFTHPKLKHFCAPLWETYSEKYLNLSALNKNKLSDDFNVKILQPLGMLRVYNKDYDFCKINTRYIKGTVDERTKKLFPLFLNSSSVKETTNNYYTPDFVYLDTNVIEDNLNNSSSCVFTANEKSLFYNKIGNLQEYIEFDSKTGILTYYLKGLKIGNDTGDNTNNLVLTYTKGVKDTTVVKKPSIFEVTGAVVQTEDFILKLNGSNFILYDRKKNTPIAYMPDIKNIIYLKESITVEIDSKNYTFVYNNGQYAISS